jgi:anti-anti-sigma regulatory factor
MEELEITVSQEQGRASVTVFHLKGRVNLGTAELLLAKAQEAIQAGARYVLLDLSEVLSVTSAGLRAFHQMVLSLRDASSAEGVEATQAAGESVLKSPHLKLLNPIPDVRRVLQIAGFDMFLEIHDDVKDAIASF